MEKECSKKYLGIMNTHRKLEVNSKLVGNASAAYFAYCRIFRILQQSAHIAYFFHTNWHFGGKLTIICVSITYFY